MRQGIPIDKELLSSSTLAYYMNYLTLSSRLYQGIMVTLVLFGLFFMAHTAFADVAVTTEPVTFYYIAGEPHVVFSSVAVDTGTGAFHIAFEVAKTEHDLVYGNPDFVGAPGYTVPQTGTLYYMVDHTFEENTTYYVRARGTDGASGCSYSSNIVSFTTPVGSMPYATSPNRIGLFDGTGICPGSIPSPTPSGSGISSSGSGARRIKNASTGGRIVAISSNFQVAFQASNATASFANVDVDPIATVTVVDVDNSSVDLLEYISDGVNDDTNTNTNTATFLGINQIDVTDTLLAQNSLRRSRSFAESTGSGMLLRGEYDIDPSCPLVAAFEIYQDGQLVRTVGPFTSTTGGIGTLMHEAQGLAPGGVYSSKFVIEQCGEESFDSGDEDTVVFAVPSYHSGGGSVIALGTTSAPSFVDSTDTSLVEITGDNANIVLSEGYIAAEEARTLVADAASASDSKKALPWILGIIAILLAVWIGRLSGKNSTEVTGTPTRV
jgi:hypothetical protein